MKKKENILSLVPPSTNKVSEEEIRIRAHEIWQREGQPHGRDCEHWIQAERELSAFHKASPVAKSQNETKKPRSKKMV